METSNHDYFLLSHTDQQNQQQQDQQQKLKPLQRKRIRGFNMERSNYDNFLPNQQGQQSRVHAQKEKIYSQDFLSFLENFKKDEDLLNKVKECIAHRNKTELPSKSATVKNQIGKIGKIQTRLHTTQQRLRTVPIMKTRLVDYSRIKEPELLQPLLPDGSE